MLSKSPFTHLVCVVLLGAIASCPLHARAANPLSLISETYSHWKNRLFGSEPVKPDVVNAPAMGPIAMVPGHPQRISIGPQAPEREFSRGKSHYRLIELAEPLDHAALRVQVIAQRKHKGRGHDVFNPVLYVLGDGDNARDPVAVKPLHLDIRPFRRTRLLGCAPLDNVQRIAVATAADAIGKSYESEVRDAVKAPTPGGFHYATDAIKVALPWSAIGVLVIEITRETKAGAGC